MFDGSVPKCGVRLYVALSVGPRTASVSYHGRTNQNVSYHGRTNQNVSYHGRTNQNVSQRNKRWTRMQEPVLSNEMNQIFWNQLIRSSSRSEVDMRVENYG
jgi:hypothetical protein